MRPRQRLRPKGVEIIVAEGLGYGDVRAPMRELAC